MLMKKCIAILLVIMMMFSITACSGDSEKSTDPTTLPTDDTQMSEEFITTKTEVMLFDMYASCNTMENVSIWSLPYNDLGTMNKYTGIESVKKIEEASIMTLVDTTLPFSVVIMKHTADADVDSIVTFLREHAPTKRWTDCIADDVAVEANGGYIVIAIMSKGVAEGLSSEDIINAFNAVTRSEEVPLQ